MILPSIRPPPPDQTIHKKQQTAKHYRTNRRNNNTKLYDYCSNTLILKLCGCEKVSAFHDDGRKKGTFFVWQIIHTFKYHFKSSELWAENEIQSVGRTSEHTKESRLDGMATATKTQMKMCVIFFSLTLSPHRLSVSGRAVHFASLVRKEYVNMPEACKKNFVLEIRK